MKVFFCHLQYLAFIFLNNGQNWKVSKTQWGLLQYLFIVILVVKVGSVTRAILNPNIDIFFWLNQITWADECKVVMQQDCNYLLLKGNKRSLNRSGVYNLPISSFSDDNIRWHFWIQEKGLRKVTYLLRENTVTLF